MPSGSPSGPPILKPVFGIFAVLGWILLIGLHVVWHYTFGWLFTTLADFIEGIGFDHFGVHFHPFHDVAAWLRSLDRNVDSALVTAANKLEHVAVWLFSRVGHVFGWLASRVEALALGVEHAIRKLILVTIPRLISRLLKLVWKELRALGRYARRMIPKLARDLLHFARWAAHEIASGVKHLGFVVKWAKAVLRAHWKAIQAAWRLLHTLEHKLIPKRFRGLVAVALGGLGLAWVFTDNIVRVGKWFARFDPGPVWEFIKDAVEFTTTTDLCKMAGYQADVARIVFEPVMQELVGLTDVLCHAKSQDLPSATGYKPGYLLAWEPSATPPISDFLTPQRLEPNIPLPRGVIAA